MIIIYDIIIPEPSTSFFVTYDHVIVIVTYDRCVIL